MSTVDSEDLVFATDVRSAGGDPRELRYAATRHELIRVRRGAYCRREQWNRLSDRDKHLLLIHAVHRLAQTPGIVAGLSAAAVWGLDVPGFWPKEVTLLSEYRGGGKSERGVRRTSVAFRWVTPHWIGELPVTSLERTAIDLARTLPFAEGLACVDGILSHPQSLGADAIAAELERMPLRAGTAKVARVLEHASSMSGSVGESEARGVIIELGFEPPELQVEFVDSQGRIFPDYYWRGVNVAGEFDGKVKFTRSEYTNGDPGEVAWREKKREDRLRRQVAGVVRILTEHVKNPPSLARLLVEAHVPRLRRGPTHALADRRAPRSPTT
jgi:hypothetical protein